MILAVIKQKNLKSNRDEKKKNTHSVQSIYSRQDVSFIQDKLAYVQIVITADIPLHKCSPRKNACQLNGRAFLFDVTSQSELTTQSNNGHARNGYSDPK